jgi:hypothetical protein
MVGATSAEAAIVQPRALWARLSKNTMTGTSRVVWRGMRFLGGGIAHHFDIAMIGGEKHQAAGLFQCAHPAPRHSSIVSTALTAASITPVCPTISGLA